MPSGIANPQQWAMSPAGINYALDHIAHVARGLHGREAINAIVSQFERPANPSREIANAAAAYGLPTTGAGQLASYSGMGGGKSPAGVNLAAILNMNNSIQGLDLPPVSAGMVGGGAQPQGSSMFPAVPSQLPPHGPTVKRLETFAAPFGLTVTSTTGGQHAPHSYHYLGRAVDFGGDTSRMAALAADALAHPHDFKEMFYTGPGHPGYFISGGRVLPLAQLDPHLYQEHTNHVHLAA